jgi:hypothetical protein
MSLTRGLNGKNVICKKENIILSRDTTNDSFHLLFDIKNDNIPLPPLINFSIFELLGKLNEDVLERVEITKKHSESDIELLYILKRFGAELGIPQKYMHIRVKAEVFDNKVIFTSESCPYSATVPSTLELIENSESQMIVTWNNIHKLDIKYAFQARVHDNLPIFMENLMGLLTKKMFYRVKTFIENMKL